MKIIKIILVLILFLLALALGSQNQAVVGFNYLIAQGEFYLSWLLGGAFVSGFIISWLIFGSMHLRAKLKVRSLTKKLERATGQKAATNKKLPKESLNAG
ncbi:LapA family protein [Vibrio sp. RC27]